MARRMHSTLDDPEVKSLVQAMLAAGKSYDEISATVLKETGKPVSRSAISRGKLRWDSAAAQLAAAKQEAETILSVLRENPDRNLGEAAMGLMLGKLTQRFANVQEGFDDADLVDLGHLLVRATRTQQQDQALGLQRERLELLKRNVISAAAEVKEKVKSAGLSDEHVREIEEKILGLVPA